MRAIRGVVRAIVGAGLLAPLPVPAADRAYLRDRTDEITWLHVGAISGWAELSGRTRRDDAQGFELRETLLSPALRVATDGSVYHRDLLEFTAAGTLSLEDQHVRGDVDRDDRSTFAQYETAAHLLDRKPLNASVSARKDDAWVESPYRESTRIRSLARGAELRLENGVLPAGVAVEHAEREEEFRDVTRREEHDTARGRLAHRASLSATEISVRQVDTRRSFQDQDYRTTAASLDHTLRPSRGSANTLRSAARWFNQYGSLRRRSLDLTEELRVRPLRALGAHARYGFIEQADPRGPGPGAGRQLVRTNRGDAGFRHDLWGSLATTVDVHASRRNVYDRTDADRAEIASVEQKGLRAGWDYRRTTPWGGLRLGFAWERGREDQQSQDRSRSVADETHALTDGNEPLLDNARVDPASVVVTDDTGFVVYEEGLDYTLVSAGSRLAIFRLPGGDIADGQTIRVDYTHEFSPDLEFDTRGRSFHARFDGSRWASVHYRYDRHREDYVSGRADGFLEDQRLHVAGLDLDLGILTFSEEYEIQRLLESEFRTNRVRVGADRRVGRTTWLALEAGHSRSEFTEVDHVQQFWTATARLTGEVSGVTLRAEAWTRLDRANRDEVGTDADLHGARLELAKRVRSLSVRVGAFVRDSDRNGLTDQRRQVFVALRRSFRMGGESS